MTLMEEASSPKRRSWRNRKSHIIPTNLVQSLSACDRKNFPNLYRLLQIACILPVTSAEAERSFSAVRRIKTCLRSCMGEDRLAALVLMNYHYKIQIDADDIIRRFIAKQPRRLFSPITEWLSCSLNFTDWQSCPVYFCFWSYVSYYDKGPHGLIVVCLLHRHTCVGKYIGPVFCVTAMNM